VKKQSKEQVKRLLIHRETLRRLDLEKDASLKVAVGAVGGSLVSTFGVGTNTQSPYC